MPSHINPEILAGFLDEVQSQISAIRHGASVLSDDPSDFAAFEEVHRFLFTIKTSAMMAGLTTLSHIAQYQAEALEEIASGLLQWTPGTTAAFATAIEQMDAYVLAASHGDVDGRQFLCEVVQAFRLMRELPLDGAGEEIEALLAQGNANAGEAAAQLGIPFDRGWEFEDLPEDLIETFQQEAGEHLAAIGEALNQLELAANKQPLLADIRRAAHTLRGAAGSVGLNQLGALAGRMEHFVDRINDGALALQGASKTLLFDTFHTLSGLSAGKDFPAGLHSKAVQLHACYDELAGVPACPSTAATAGWE